MFSKACSEVCFSSDFITAFIIIFELLVNFMASKYMIEVFSFKAIWHNLNLILDLFTDEEQTKFVEKILNFPERHLLFIVQKYLKLEP